MKSYGAVIRLLETAFDGGITHFDTAPLYGQGYAEDITGRFIKNKRDRVTITTKFGLGAIKRLTVPATIALTLNHYRKALKKAPAVQQLPVDDAPPELLSYRSISAADVRNSLTQSLQRLRTNYIDYYFLHEGLPGFLEPAAREYLFDRRQQGIIRFLGVATNSHNLLTQKPEELSKWDVLQYEAGDGGAQLLQLFPGKQHFLHSCMKGLHKQAGAKTTQYAGGHRLATYAKDPLNSKLIFSTRRIEILKQNLEGFNTNTQ
jgi:predicted aldo/keto reductase-like oxidoreductase